MLNSDAVRQCLVHECYTQISRTRVQLQEVLLALRDVDLREGRHVGPFPRGGPLASFQGNIPDLMNDTCEDLSVIPPNPKGNEIWSHSGFLQML